MAVVAYVLLSTGRNQGRSCLQFDCPEFELGKETVGVTMRREENQRGRILRGQVTGRGGAARPINKRQAVQPHADRTPGFGHLRKHL